MENPNHPSLFRLGLSAVCLTLLTGLAGCVSTRTASSGAAVSANRDAGELDQEETLTPQNQDFAEALAYFSQALTQEFQGNSAEAANNYLLAIERDPDNETLYMLAARRLLGQGNRDQAFDLMEDLQARQPDNAKVKIWVALLHLAIEEETEAIEAFRLAIEADPTREAPYLESARLLIKQGKEAEAIALLDQAIDQTPGPLRSTRMRIELLLRSLADILDAQEAREVREQLGEYITQARERFPAEDGFTLQAAALEGQQDNIIGMFDLYRELVTTSPNNAGVRQTVLVHFVNSMGNGNQAARKLDRFLTLHPEDSMVLYMRAQLHELAEENDQALALTQRALEQAPNDLPLIMRAAALLAGNDQNQAAFHLVERATREAPDNPDLQRLAASLLMDRGDFAGALERLRTMEKALDQGQDIGNTAHFHYSYAVCLQAEGYRSEAVDALATAYETDARFLEIFWRQQMIYARQALPDETLRKTREADLLLSLQDLADRLPGDPGVVRMIATHLLINRDFAAAVEAFEDTITLAERQENPAAILDAEFYYDYGSALERSGDREQMEVMMEKAITLDPEHANAYNYLAYSWAEMGENLDQAMEYVTRALRMEANNGAFIDTRGWIYYHQGNYQEAYSDLLRASELIENDPTITEHLGDVLMKLDRPVEAAAYFRIALELEDGSRTEELEARLAAAEEAVAKSIEPEPVQQETGVEPDGTEPVQQETVVEPELPEPVPTASTNQTDVVP